MPKTFTTCIHDEGKVGTDVNGHQYLNMEDWDTFPKDSSDELTVKYWMEDHGFKVICVRCFVSRISCSHLWPCKGCTNAGVPCLLVRPAPAAEMLADCAKGIYCMDAHTEYLQFIEQYYQDKGGLPADLQWWRFPEGEDTRSYPGGTMYGAAGRGKHPFQAPDAGIAAKKSEDNPAGFEGLYPPLWVCETFRPPVCLNKKKEINEYYKLSPRQRAALESTTEDQPLPRAPEPLNEDYQTVEVARGPGPFLAAFYKAFTATRGSDNPQEASPQRTVHRSGDDTPTRGSG